jgi:hypothetical protein
MTCDLSQDEIEPKKKKKKKGERKEIGIKTSKEISSNFIVRIVSALTNKCEGRYETHLPR